MQKNKKCPIGRQDHKDKRSNKGKPHKNLKDIKIESKNRNLQEMADQRQKNKDHIYHNKNYNPTLCQSEQLDRAPE